MITTFKNIAKKKDLHYAKFSIEEKKGDAEIKSQIQVNLEDANISLDSSLNDIIEKASSIAVNEYRKK